MTRDAVIEAMSDAMRASQAFDDEGTFPILLDLLDFSGENKARTVTRFAAKDALAAIEALGFAVVPRVATEYMIDIGACHEDQDHDIFDEGHIAHEVYNAMIEAGKV
jgi:hypothetical protein